MSRALVVGDCWCNCRVEGAVERISPEAPVPVLLNQSPEIIDLGGAALVTQSLASLGHEVTFCGSVGNDLFGQKIKQKLGRCCKAVHWSQETPAATYTVHRFYAARQQLMQVEVAAQVKATWSFPPELDKFDHIVVYDYGYGAVNASIARELVHHNGHTCVVLGGNWDPEFNTGRFPYLVVLDEKDASRFDVRGCGAGIIRHNYAEATYLSARGYMQAVGKHKLAEGVMTSLDLVGTQEAFLAAFVHAVMSPQYTNSTPDALRLACEVASYAAQRRGPVILDRHLIAAATSHTTLVGSLLGEVLSVDAAAAYREAHADRHKIVLVIGAFDPISPVDVRFLQLARQLGDLLIVAVKSTEQVILEYGQETIPLADRAAVLAAMSAVDVVMPIRPETSIDWLVARLRPDILADAAGKLDAEIPGADTVLKQGGAVHQLAAQLQAGT